MNGSFRVPFGLATRILYGLVLAGASLAEVGAQTPAPKLEDAMIAAAQAGDGAGISELILQSYKRGGTFDESLATEMLNRLVLGENLRTFTTLLDQLRQTNQGKSWQPSDAALEELVAKSRREFLDALLARGLVLTRLTSAAQKAEPETKAWIERRVAEVNKSRTNINELVKSTAAGDLEKMRMLLDAGSEIDGVSSDDWTPLTRAASKNQVEAVRLLLERGAKVDLPRHPGWDYTPLCLTRSVAIAELLKAAGANVHATLFKRDVSILTYIARWGGADMVEWMLKQGVDPKKLGDNKQTLLFDAKDVRSVELLLAAGVDPNHVDEFGRTALESAQSAEVVEKLTTAMFGSGPAPKRSVAGMILGFSKASAMEALIKKQGGLDPRDGQQALLSASHVDHDDFVRVLLANGAQANEPGFLDDTDKYPMLPLMLCAIHGSPKTAKVLLEYGADPNCSASFGSILETALRNGHVEVAKVLREAGAKGVSDLAFALGTKDEEKVAQLLASAPEYDQQPEFWLEVLPAAARVGHIKAVQAALEKGVPNPSGEDSSIAVAASEGQYEVLDLLLARRTRLDDPQHLRKALRNAVWNSHPYDTQARRAEAFEKSVALLLAAGVSPKLEDGVDALVGVAVFTRNPGGNPKVVELLVAAGANPNPEVSEKVRLIDYMQKICEAKACGTPTVKTIEMVEKLTHLSVKR